MAMVSLVEFKFKASWSSKEKERRTKKETEKRKYKLNDKLLIIHSLQLSSPLYNCLMLPVAVTTELIIIS